MSSWALAAVRSRAAPGAALSFYALGQRSGRVDGVNGAAVASMALATFLAFIRAIFMVAMAYYAACKNIAQVLVAQQATSQEGSTTRECVSRRLLTDVAAAC